MKKYLITGCAGFIGSNFVYYMLKKYDDILLVNLDKLTYAGNLENLKGVEGDPRHVFVQGDICDKELVTKLFGEYDFDYVINFAAESHVDRSITNPEKRGMMPRRKPGKKAKSMFRSARTKCTARSVPKGSSWRPRQSTLIARTALPRLRRTIL